MIYISVSLLLSSLRPIPPQESLAIDRAKEEAKKDEEKRVQQEIEREELMQRAEQKRIAHEKELRTAIQKSIQVQHFSFIDIHICIIKNRIRCV